jgi:hypothetical protein
MNQYESKRVAKLKREYIQWKKLHEVTEDDFDTILFFLTERDALRATSELPTVSYQKDHYILIIKLCTDGDFSISRDKSVIIHNLWEEGKLYWNGDNEEYHLNLIWEERTIAIQEAISTLSALKDSTWSSQWGFEELIGEFYDRAIYDIKSDWECNINLSGNYEGSNILFTRL